MIYRDSGAYHGRASKLDKEIDPATFQGPVPSHIFPAPEKKNPEFPADRREPLDVDEDEADEDYKPAVKAGPGVSRLKGIRPRQPHIACPVCGGQTRSKGRYLDGTKRRHCRDCGKISRADGGPVRMGPAAIKDLPKCPVCGADTISNGRNADGSQQRYCRDSKCVGQLRIAVSI